MQTQTIPYGCCHCGCGQRTTIAARSNRSKGWVEGQPLKFVRGHGRRKRLLHDWSEFYGEVPGPLDSPCWEWKGTRDPKGYADRMHVGGGRVEAHRAFYERAKGPVPTGMDLDHLCRNRACVNPEHLEPVTHAENMRRGAVTKLTVEQVRDIRARHEHGESMKALASVYGVSYWCIRNVVSRRTWRDV